VSPVKYHEAAEAELLNEIAYFELQVAGLGRRFYAEVQRADHLIAQFPESGPELSPGIRKHIVRTFPFSLIYSIEKDGLLILAVAHPSRRPRYWVRRAKTIEGDLPTGA
jgi:toxin ParE2